MKNNQSNTKIAVLALFVFACADAFAQNTLRDVGISIFNYIYGAVGIAGAIALLVFAVNMKFHFIPNPMKHFLQTLGALILAFSVVALVQFAKSFTSGISVNSL